MATGARPALGLSIGVTNLAAVAADHSITRKPVLTLYRQRPPEVGVPSENPRLDEPGLVITDFVDRVGDSVGIVAADGSVYRSEALVADALLALAYTATGGRALPGSVTVTYPAHWGPAAVAALDSALRRASEWSHGTSSTAQPLSLLPDAAAALYAIRADPGTGPWDRRGMRLRWQRDRHHARRRRRRVSAGGRDGAPSGFLRRSDRSVAVELRHVRTTGHGRVRSSRHLGDRLTD